MWQDRGGEEEDDDDDDDNNSNNNNNNKLLLETMRDLVRYLDPFLGQCISSFVNSLTTMTFFEAPFRSEDLLHGTVTMLPKLLVWPDVEPL